MIEAFESGGPMVAGGGGVDDVQAAVESLRSRWAALDGLLLDAGGAGWPDMAPAEAPEAAGPGVGALPARDDDVAGALTSLAALAVAPPAAIGAAGGFALVAAGGDATPGPVSLAGPEMGVAGLVGGGGPAIGGGTLLYGDISGPVGLSPAVPAGMAAPGAAEIAPERKVAPDRAGMVADRAIEAGSGGLDFRGVPAAVGDVPGWPGVAASLVRDDPVSNIMMTGFSVAPGLNAPLAGSAPGVAAGMAPLAAGAFASDAPSPSWAALPEAMAQPVRHDGIGLADAVPVPPVQDAPPADTVLPWSAPVPRWGLPGGDFSPLGPPPDREWSAGGQAHRTAPGEAPGQAATQDDQGGAAAPIVVHTEVHLDGAVLARAVTDRIVLGMNGPLSGTGGFDGRRSYTPVEG